MLKPMPAIYDKIFVIGAPASASKAAVGGRWWQPSLGLSYLLAARHVIEGGYARTRLSEVALPAAYLQRHALEVELKSWIESAYEVKYWWDWIAALEKDPEAEPPPRATLKHEHRHQSIRGELDAALKAADLEPLPASVVELIEAVAEAEANAPERYRYRVVKVGDGKGAPLQEAFPKKQEVPILETQAAMEHVFETVFHVDPKLSKERHTWGGRIAYTCYGLGQHASQKYPSVSE